MSNIESLSVDVVEKVGALLGRPPRGLEAIPVWSDCGDPSVIRVASLVDGKPFPTLFWLVDKQLNYNISTLEAAGLIKEFQKRVNQSASLQEGLIEDHKSYIRCREHFMSEIVKQQLHELGYWEGLACRGIGGIANFTSIRCFHTYYAAHLVRPNTIGRMLDEYWAEHESPS